MRISSLFFPPFALHFLDPEMAGVPEEAKRPRQKRTAQVNRGYRAPVSQRTFCSADAGMKLSPTPGPNASSCQDVLSYLI